VNAFCCFDSVLALELFGGQSDAPGQMNSNLGTVISRVDWPWVVFVTFIFANLLTGPLRWILAISGLVPLIYLPIVMVGAAFMGGVLLDAYKGRIGRAYFVTLMVVMSSLVCGLINVGSVIQVFFGFYGLWPFFFGLVYGESLVRRVSTAKKGSVWVWLIACVGVIINSVFTYPWEGFEYSVGGMDIESSREWYAGDAKRLGGFSRASFDAAIQISLASCLAICAYRHVLAKIVIAAVSLVAIYFTNAKGMLLSFMVMFGLSFLNDVWLDRLKVPTFSALLLFGMGLPIVSWLIQYEFDITGVAANPLYFSFTDRIENMWPEALALLHERGNVFLGRGFGGIGVAQTYFESLIFNAADNIYVYLSLIAGLFMFPVSAIILILFMTRRDGNVFVERFSYLLFVTVLVYGLTANVLENAPMALVTGMLVRFGCSKVASR
jgi:hypothetical protein